MRLFFMTALLGVVTAQAAEVDTPLDTLRSVELQNVQVVATRATKKTPVAFTNVGKEQLKAVNFGQDIPYLLSLTPSITMTSDAGNGIGYTSLRVRGTDPSRSRGCRSADSGVFAIRHSLRQKLKRWLLHNTATSLIYNQ